MFSQAAADLHGEFAGAVDGHGVLQWIALSGAGPAEARARGAIDAGAVREAVRADEQERLPGRGSHGGSGATGEDAFCTDQEEQLDGQALHRVRERWVM